MNVPFAGNYPGDHQHPRRRAGEWSPAAAFPRRLGAASPDRGVAERWAKRPAHGQGAEARADQRTGRDLVDVADVPGRFPMPIAASSRRMSCAKPTRSPGSRTWLVLRRECPRGARWRWGGQASICELMFRRSDPAFVVLDVLALEGRDLCALALIGRKKVPLRRRPHSYHLSSDSKRRLVEAATVWQHRSLSNAGHRLVRLHRGGSTH
jgi:hypothetical protein